MRQPFEITETNANFTRGSDPFVVVWCFCQKLGCGAPSDTNTTRFTKQTLERKTVAGLLLIFVFAPRTTTVCQLGDEHSPPRPTSSAVQVVLSSNPDATHHCAARFSISGACQIIEHGCFEQRQPNIIAINCSLLFMLGTTAAKQRYRWPSCHVFAPSLDMPL